MPRPGRAAPWRSCHVVPASNPRFLAKAAGLGADRYVFDLEDAVAPAAKDAARAAVIAAVHELDWGPAPLAVRVNGWDSPWTYRDVVEVVSLAGARIDSVVLPKAGSAAEVAALDLLLGQVESEAGLPGGSVGVQVLVESARGVADIDAICAASPRLRAVILGPLDLAAQLRMPAPAGDPQDRFHYVRMRLVAAARVHGVRAIDGPTVGLRDPDGLTRSAGAAAALGYDGKWSIHPDQIDVLNAAFGAAQTGASSVRELPGLP